MSEEALVRGVLAGSSGIAPGWHLWELPRTAPDTLQLFIGVLGGAQEVRWLTAVNYEDGSVAGRLLVSPKGMGELRAYAWSTEQ